MKYLFSIIYIVILMYIVNLFSKHGCYSFGEGNITESCAMLCGQTMMVKPPTVTLMTS